ncbi:MAG: peptidoglycan-binding domain-containing protein, partial [Chitinophagales bacterium]
KEVIDQPASTKEITIPAEYKTITKQVLVTPAAEQVIDIPAEYKTVTKTVLASPATTKKIDIPAEYKTVTKTVVDQPAAVKETTIPAEYQTITKNVLVKKGGYNEWKEILCGDKVTSYTISQIQQALLDRGYDVGPAGVDNILGKDTRQALIKYQQDNNLPVGNLNIETLKALGVKY